MVEVAHQCRARSTVGNLLGGAAHVDVDDVGPLRLGDAGTFGHPVRLAPGELHDVDPYPGTLTANAGLAFPARQAGARGHFRYHQTGTEPLCEATERRIGNP